MQKNRVIKSLENLTPELRIVLKKQYPDGFEGYLMRIMNAKNEPIFVVPMQTDDTMYLVKVAVTRTSDGDFDIESDVDDREDFDEREVDEGDEPSEDPDYD